MKRLSVIVPVYNGAGRIKRCIESLWAQTYQELELIIIDDGSKDESFRILQDMLQNSDRPHPVTRLLHQENQGVAKTRNSGILMAQGEYVTFVDQDDYVTTDYCERYMQEAQQWDADIVIGGYERISDEGKVSRRVSLTQQEWSKFVMVAPWGHVYRREFLLQNQIEFLHTGIGEDIYFNLVAYAYTKKIHIIPDTSYRWVDNPASVSNSRQNSIHEGNDPFVLLQALKERLPEENELGEEQEEYFFLRYMVWYFSFTVRGSRREDVERMYHRFTQWLEQYYPHYGKNPNIRPGRPKGDPFMIRISVWLFCILQRMHLILPVLKMLSKK
ncbi:MAG: glycosyltransferase family 2 protein [Roseburia sp.]